MGAWSHESFGNDDACDWAYDLENSQDLSIIDKTIDSALSQGSEYLEAPDASEAVAAIEVVAKLLGRGTQQDSYTELVDAWVSKVNLVPSNEQVDKSVRVLDLVLSERSELAELWEGSEDWIGAINKLKSALIA